MFDITEEEPVFLINSFSALLLTDPLQKNWQITSLLSATYYSLSYATKKNCKSNSIMWQKRQKKGLILSFFLMPQNPKKDV